VSDRADKQFFVVNAVVSTGALGFLVWLTMLRQAGPQAGNDISWMPALNAVFNSISAVLLVVGWWFIRQRNMHAHRLCMVGAMASSTMFLVSYIVYHSMKGDTKFTGEGIIRPLYFTILISHIVLSAVIVPGALAAFWFALRKRFDTHKRVTKILLPIWLYVSVTGVLIFLLLRAYSGAPAV
jgi:putative membrane protein